MHMLVPAFVLVISLTTAATGAAGGSITNLATRVASLRGEVDSLAAELETRKEEQRAQLRSLAEQRADLELQLRREELRGEQLQAARERQREEIGDKLDLDEDLRPILARALDDLEQTIRVGLPFRTGDRLADLEKLRNQVQSGLVRPQDATYRLWQMFEDELRLRRESGLYRQTILLDGRESLVDVARIGMVALYFCTSDERFGRAVRAENGWTFELLTDSESRRQLRELFDAFKKQIRVGAFELPNGLARGETP
jgi:F0F1-type ATP synthase membrane subunit b/b'